MPSYSNHQSAEQLTDAFMLFNELSETLVTAYQKLEQQVAVLNLQLAAAQSEKLNALAEKERMAERLRQILAALPAAVLVLDTDYRIVDHNELALTWLGLPLLKESWRAVERRCCQPAGDNPHERTLRCGRQVSLNYSRLPGDQGTIALLSDISDLKNLQELLHQQQHLSAMGEMVASMAHQVRTPLAAAMLYASRLPKLRTDPDKHQHYAEKTLERLRFMEAQVGDMLLYAKTGRMTKNRIDLAAFVQSLDEAAREHLPESIDWHIQREFDATCLQGNEPALKGALLNLINNAIDAMGADGRLVLRILSDDKRLRFSLTDNGHGLPKEDSRRIFEPFFTTKTCGTGLGLAVVASVARAHGGSISAEPAASGGAVFHLELPLSADAEPTLPGGYSARQLNFKEMAYESV